MDPSGTILHSENSGSPSGLLVGLQLTYPVTEINAKMARKLIILEKKLNLIFFYNFSLHNNLGQISGPGVLWIFPI